MTGLIKFMFFQWKPKPIRGAVYKITIGKNVYIGGTTQPPHRRMSQHMESLKAGTHTNYGLQWAYDKHSGAIGFKVLWQSSATFPDELASKENELMKAENQYFLCNLKPAAAEDYQRYPLSKSDRWTYPFIVWLIVTFVMLVALDLAL